MPSYVAKKVAGKKMEGMMSPLLDSDDDTSVGSDDSDASSEEETVKRSPMEKLKSLVVNSGLGGSAALSVGAMVLSPSIAVFAMGGLCVANVPYAAVKEHKIAKIPSLRSMNNKLRESANALGEQVDVLAEEIDLLGPEADRAAAVEQELKNIAEKQNINVTKLVELVKENGEILALMRDNLRQRVVQDIIAIVTRSDTNNDDSIDRSEAKTLALRIRISLQEYGVVFDTQKFLKAIGDEPTVTKVIGMIQKLFPAQKEKKDDDSDSDSDEDSDDDMDDEVYDMFYMAEEEEEGDAHRGSNPRASGIGGVSLMTCDKKSNRQSTRSSTIRRSVMGSTAGRKSKSGKSMHTLMQMVEEGSDSEGSDADGDY
mmetsp:Transcript_25726/g.46611  ORF Transcript_25726/g.46611 Transcript_25726/m.46611 type:complete len:370 (-) Transcript_25726:98-1207(-)